MIRQFVNIDWNLAHECCCQLYAWCQQAGEITRQDSRRPLKTMFFPNFQKGKFSKNAVKKCADPTVKFFRLTITFPLLAEVFSWKITFPWLPANGFFQNSKSWQEFTLISRMPRERKNSLQAGVEMYWSARKNTMLISLFLSFCWRFAGTFFNTSSPFLCLPV